MAAIVEFDLETRDIREHAVGGPVPGIRDSESCIWWIDLDAGESGRLEGLAGELGLSKEDLEPMLLKNRKPSLVERDDSLTLTLYGWPAEPGVGEPSAFTLHLTGRCCVTISDGPVDCLDELRRTYRREFRFAKSPGFLLFLVLDALVDGMARAFTPLEDKAEDISDRIYTQFGPRIHEEILGLKKRIFSLKRTLNPARDVLMRLSGRRIPVVIEEGRQSLGEVYGHAERLESSFDSLRDFVSSLLDAYLAVQSQRLNETMKVLTIFASILLPMTLVAGIYGMNFAVMPELHWKWGYAFALALMGVAGGLVFVLFRSRRWI